MLQENDIYVSRNTTALDLFAGEEIIFKIRGSLLLLIFKITGLAILGGIVYWIFVKFKFAQSIGLGPYAFWVNLVPWIVVGIVILAILIQWLSTTYLLTTKRVQISVSFLSAYDQSISLTHVESVKMERSIFGFFLNYGNIIIKSAAANFQIIFAGISDPKKYLNLIKENIG